MRRPSVSIELSQRSVFAAPASGGYQRRLAGEPSRRRMPDRRPHVGRRSASSGRRQHADSSQLSYRLRDRRHAVEGSEFAVAHPAMSQQIQHRNPGWPQTLHGAAHVEDPTPNDDSWEPKFVPIGARVGRSGQVFEADGRTGLGGRVVKLFTWAAGLPAQVVQDFTREAMTVADLRHPHVAQVLDAGTFGDGTPFVVMERLAGMTLDEAIEWQVAADCRGLADPPRRRRGAVRSACGRCCARAAARRQRVHRGCERRPGARSRNCWTSVWHGSQRKRTRSARVGTCSGTVPLSAPISSR